VPAAVPIAFPSTPTKANAIDDPDAEAVRQRMAGDYLYGGEPKHIEGVRVDQEFEEPDEELFVGDAHVGDIVKSAPLAAAPAPAPATVVALRPITYEDIDRLWDWCRQDPKGAGKYLGHVPSHSFALQQYMQKQLAMQDGGTALVCAIDIASDRGPMHIGFVSLLPINRVSTPPVGVAHCYLRLEAQGALPQLMPQMLAEAARLEPTLTLMVSVDDYAFARLLQPFGFTLTITLTRPPATAQR
jgi:hypothetical protein